MASRRKLKKDVHNLSHELFSECCIVTALIARADNEKAEAVLTKIVELEASFIARINSLEERHNTHLVKKHFAKLKADWSLALSEIEAEMNVINK